MCLLGRGEASWVPLRSTVATPRDTFDLLVCIRLLNAAPCQVTLSESYVLNCHGCASSSPVTNYSIFTSPRGSATGAGSSGRAGCSGGSDSTGEIGIGERGDNGVPP